MTRLIAFLLLVTAASWAAYEFLTTEDTPRNAELPTYTIDNRDVVVSVTEQGTLESANNTEIKCRVRGDNTITYVIESGVAVEEGDVLVQLETLAIEEEISERTKFFHLAEAQVADSKVKLENAKIAVEQYIEGTFPTAKANLETQLAGARAKLLSHRNQLKHLRMMKQGNYSSEVDVEREEFREKSSQSSVELIETQIEVLETYTREQELVRLNGEVKAAQATLEADLERSLADKKRLDRAKEELELCTIRAQRSGLVIYPKGERWEDVPEIEEGATVKKDQTLLLMPDLQQMQVKVGVHESLMDRMATGIPVNITLNRNTVAGKVSYVASVAQPAGWWTGNVVKYDSIVALPEIDGLRPGMSAEVEIIFAEHFGKIAILFNACVETDSGFACWSRSGDGQIVRRALELGDGNEMFIVVESGLQLGEQVVLDPLTHVAEAQREAAALRSKSDSQFGYEDL